MEGKVPRPRESLIPSIQKMTLSALTWEIGPLRAPSPPNSIKHLIFMHGIGLAGTLVPMIEDFIVQTQGSFYGTITSVDTRFHGKSSQGPDVKDTNWWLMGIDALKAVEYIRENTSELNARFASAKVEYVGIGHSMGGNLLSMAQSLGAKLTKLFLIEPMLIPSPYFFNEEISESKMALKRQKEFPSFEAAVENFKTKKSFSSWDPRALEAYVRGSFAQKDGKVELIMAPITESTMFSNGGTNGTFELFHKDLAEEVFVCSGLKSFWLEFIGDKIAAKTGLKVKTYEGLTHFCPMENPPLLARELKAFLFPQSKL